MSEDRTQQITATLQAIASRAMALVDNTSDVAAAAKAANNDAADAEIKGRDALMTEIATASVQGNWTEAEITDAAYAVLRAFNRTDDKKVFAAFKSMVSEFKAAMHANARAHVGNLIKLRDAAMADEADRAFLDSSAPQPIKAAWANRKYHILNALIGEAKNFGRVYTTVPEVVAFAKHCDPAYDGEKMHKKLSALIKQLKAWNNECDLNAVSNVCSDLAGITLQDVNSAIKARPAKPALAHPIVGVVKAPDVVTPKLTIAPKPSTPAPPAKIAPKSDAKVIQQEVKDTVSALESLVA